MESFIHTVWQINLLLLLLPAIPRSLSTGPAIPPWVSGMWLESQGLAFVSSAFSAVLDNAPSLLDVRAVGADLREGASSLEELPTVLWVTNPNVPKVLVFHDITALRGQEGATWEQRPREATHQVREQRACDTAPP